MRFADVGPALHGAGWDIIPVKAKTKKPGELNWQNGFTAEQVAKFAGNGYAEGSVGLLAKRFPGVDIDVSDEECAVAIEKFALARLGSAPMRFGAFPKRLLMYGTDTPFSKLKVYLTGPNGPKGTDGKDYAVEVLGDGQQYLIYGEHPDGFEYRWPSGGGPKDCDVWDLSPLSKQAASDFLAALPECLPTGWSVRGTATGGGSASDDAFANYKPALEGWDLDRVVAEVLPHLDADCGYEDWVKVGQSLHHQGGGDGDWLAAWDDWSQGSGKYAEGLCERKWDSFSTGRSKGSVTLASLLSQTKDARGALVAQEKRSASEVFMAAIKAELEAVVDVRELETNIASKAAKEKSMGDVERAILATLIHEKAKSLGVKLEMPKVRGWLKPKGRAGRGFKHITEDGTPLCTLENLETLLGRLSVVVRYNVISKQTEVLIPEAGPTRDNRDNVALAYVLSECEKVRMSTKFVPQFLLSLGDANLYNPVMTWVGSREWDGVSRLEDFYATVEVDATAMPPALKVKLLRKWLVQSIHAASVGGGNYRGILTFTGAQNIGKTTWFKNLAPRELDLILTGHTLDTKSKDSQLAAISHWIVELGEVDATFRKSDLSALKSYIGLPMDVLRRPYAAVESRYDRRTVFGASVNDEQFLADKTGNSRFWTMPVSKFQFDHGVDMQQLWAEALALLVGGEDWSMSPEEMEQLNKHNENFETTDPIAERLSTFFDWEGPIASWSWVTATQALMLIGVKEPKKPDAIAAGAALKRLNGGQRKKSSGKILFAVPSEASEFLK